MVLCQRDSLHNVFCLNVHTRAAYSYYDTHDCKSHTFVLVQARMTYNLAASSFIRQQPDRFADVVLFYTLPGLM